MRKRQSHITKKGIELHIHKTASYMELLFTYQMYRDCIRTLRHTLLSTREPQPIHKVHRVHHVLRAPIATQKLSTREAASILYLHHCHYIYITILTKRMYNFYFARYASAYYYNIETNNLDYKYRRAERLLVVIMCRLRICVIRVVLR